MHLHFWQWKNECMCGRCSQMCSDTLFSWRPLLSFCCGLLVGSIPVQDDIIVQAEGRKYCKKIVYESHSSHARTSAQGIPAEFQKDQAELCHILQSCYSQFGFFCTLHCQISRHVTTMLFICLQKLNTAMPPCHPSSALERGKAWKGKAKARKTQVAGKGYTAPRGHKLHTWLFVKLATSRPSYPHFKYAPTECSRINPLFPDWCLFFMSQL